VALRIAIIANFQVAWSTGNDLSDTLQRMGVVVEGIHEADEDAWSCLIARMRGSEAPDAVIWNRTPAYARQIGREMQFLMLKTARDAEIPTIAYHLDRFWGLNRENEVSEEPFFRCDYCFTADGHDPERWKDLGINHFWLPPAIAPRHAFIGLPEPRFRASVAFIGTQWGYHGEWGHRVELIRWLRRYFGREVLFLPNRNMGTRRGLQLNNVVAGVKVIVGDSCLVEVDGKPYERYCSDRVFEIPGRGGFLVHPYVEGVIPRSGPGDEWGMIPGKHLEAFELGDFKRMRDVVQHYLDHDDERTTIAKQGFEHVIENHSYANRLRQAFDIAGLPL
jgi:hypothetical protein